MEMFDFAGPLAPAVRALFLTALAIMWSLLLARIVGLRSFSKASAFDFVATVATGSLVAQAGTRDNWPAFVQAMGAIGAVFLVRYLLAFVRKRSSAVEQAIENAPVLLIEDGRYLREAMRETRVTQSTLLEKMRMADVASLAEVRAAILETTGDITIMTASSIDPALLEGVARVGPKDAR